MTPKPALQHSGTILLCVAIGVLLPRLLRRHLYLSPQLRAAETWIMVACALIAIAAALWLYQSGKITPFAKAANGSRKRQIFDLAGIGAFGLVIGYFAPALVPLAGTPVEVTVTVKTNVYGGTSARICAHALPLVDTPDHPICVSKSQMAIARSWKSTRGKALLKGWGNPMGVYYWEVILLGPTPQDSPEPYLSPSALIRASRPPRRLAVCGASSPARRTALIG